ncbi:acetolactate decarboxylase [Subtercola sp. RTI3]|uniref:acetolactate decarboxylase n=1 Tax=Subtercola sp. RTI3 TaxID=3048639 RepID=UPI002B239042|nr:acetolactate decarboxylase [Subtercola sp. RTI3]MEA9985879.1 acetolactate decarboxylase [Subtercola sp. RTI3]
MPHVRHRVFQASTMSALLDGVYDGDLSVGELLEQGDFGLGTFNALDGEMLVLDGVCWRLQADGTVSAAAPDALTPFAVITRFEAQQSIRVPAPMSRAEVVAAINAAVSSQNYLFAVKVSGRFEWVRTRTVRRQEKPYVALREAVKDEAELEFRDLDGTVAGFRTPLYERGIGVPGGHVHFIDDELKQGGHVLDFSIASGVIEICQGTDLELRLPLTGAFERADLDPGDLDAQVEETENRH